MSGAYARVLDRARQVVLYVEFTTVRRDVVDYAVVLTVQHAGRRETVRVYDGTHGFNELHRHTLAGGKQPAEVFHHGTLGEGMREAIVDCVQRYEQMIEGWKR